MASHEDEAPGVLRAADVRIERGDSWILDGVSLSVAANDRLLIRGRSGAGKTTLFRVLGLLDPPTAGEVYVDGAPSASGLAFVVIPSGSCFKTSNSSLT